MAIEQEIDGLFEIVHEAFCTDRLTIISTLVKANSASEALQKYNELAKEREGYPYLWNQAASGAVHKAKAIV